MSGLRILIANEPRSYREILVECLKRLRPSATTVAVEPEQLDCAVERIQPHLVVCSHMTETVMLQVIAWVMLYPDGHRVTISRSGGDLIANADLEFDQLLDLIDQTAGRLVTAA